MHFWSAYVKAQRRSTACYDVQAVTHTLSFSARVTFSPPSIYIVN